MHVHILLSFSGHYSIVEPDGSIRTVEYSAGPGTGFQASVNSETTEKDVQGRSAFENKAMRDYEHYDFSEDTADYESYPKKYKKRENLEEKFREYMKKKLHQTPMDHEASAYTHSYSIKHPYHDEATAESESHSHFGINTDPNCKKKKKNENNLYTSVTDLDLGKQKYPNFPTNPFKDDFGKYEAQPTFDSEKISTFMNTKSKFEDIKPPSKYNFPPISEISSPDKFYPEDMPLKPKKKYKPYKKPEYQLPSDDLDDYILVPKKKLKNPMRYHEPNEYPPEMDEEYDRPLSLFNENDDDRFHPIRGSAQKEVVRKVVKKKKPVINLLDIFDI